MFKMQKHCNPKTKILKWAKKVEHQSFISSLWRELVQGRSNEEKRMTCRRIKKIRTSSFSNFLSGKWKKTHVFLHFLNKLIYSLCLLCILNFFGLHPWTTVQFFKVVCGTKKVQTITSSLKSLTRIICVCRTTPRSLSGPSTYSAVAQPKECQQQLWRRKRDRWLTWNKWRDKWKWSEGWKAAGKHGSEDGLRLSTWPKWQKNSKFIVNKKTHKKDHFVQATGEHNWGMNTADNSEKKEFDEINLISLSNTVVDPWTVMVH